jgi:hypothetical protein
MTAYIILLICLVLLLAVASFYLSDVWDRGGIPLIIPGGPSVKFKLYSTGKTPAFYLLYDLRQLKRSPHLTSVSVSAFQRIWIYIQDGAGSTFFAGGILLASLVVSSIAIGAAYAS